MKDKIHPAYKETTIVCACGEAIQTRSTKQNIHIEICSKCHPFYTGKQKLIDSAGRVDKYIKRFGKKKAPKAKKKLEVKKENTSLEKNLEKLNPDSQNENKSA